MRVFRQVVRVVCLVFALVIALAGEASADPTFGVQHADGGIYWRSAPDWNTAEATPGNGFYPDSTIAVHCYQSGAGNVPGSSNTMWEKATIASGSGSGSGWVNEHFINDGSPINQPSPGVPPCTGDSQPQTGAQFHTMNADGGIYWRSGPDWNTAQASPGNGFYPDTILSIICYQRGAGNVPGSSNTMWEKATIASGSGSGSGWVNEHFIDDGSPINQPSPGVPPCNAGGGSTGGQGSAAVFFLPKDNDRATAADYTIPYEWWRASNCQLLGGLPSVPNKQVTTLAGWSNGRLGPIYYLNAATDDAQKRITYVLLIDPGYRGQFASSCDATVHPGRVLRHWLSLDPRHSRLVIIAAEATNRDGRAGLRSYYLNNLSAAQRSKQTLICDERQMPHGTAFNQFASPSGSQLAFLKSQKFRCPYGVPTVGG